MKRAIIGVVASLLLTQVGYAYQNRTHHGISAAARSYLLDPGNGHHFDPDFIRLLADPGPPDYGCGNFMDNRAGDEHPVDNKDHKISWTDEDRTDGATATSDRGRG